MRPIDLKNLENAVKNARENTDWVIISFHWGEEYRQQPTNRQKLLAYSTIDFGADIIIGHHPHIVQPLEYYKEKPIFYSIGNFLFDQLWSRETREGMVGKIIIEKDKIKEIQMIPIYINDQYQIELKGE